MKTLRTPASVVRVPKTKRALRLSQGNADPCRACVCRTLRSPMRTLQQSLGARQSLDHLATPCHRPCRAALRGCPSAQPAATRAPQRAPLPPAGRTRHRHGPRARPAARAAPRTHCGLRACTESASRTRLGRWRSVPELPWEPAPIAHGLLSAAGGRLRSPDAAD